MASNKIAGELVARFLGGETIEATVESVEAGELGWIVKCGEGVWFVLGDAPIPKDGDRITASADAVEAGEGVLLNSRKAQLWDGPSVQKADVVRMESLILREREETRDERV